jgi:hypothetical protein
VLNYDPLTGQQRWKTRPSNRVKIGGMRPHTVARHQHRAVERSIAVVTLYRQSIAGSSAGNRIVPSKKTPRGECPIAALSPSRVTDEANFGRRCWRRRCPPPQFEGFCSGAGAFSGLAEHA